MLKAQMSKSVISIWNGRNFRGSWASAELIVFTVCKHQMKGTLGGIQSTLEAADWIERLKRKKEMWSAMKWNKAHSSRNNKCSGLEYKKLYYVAAPHRKVTDKHCLDSIVDMSIVYYWLCPNSPKVIFGSVLFLTCAFRGIIFNHILFINCSIQNNHSLL